MRELGRGRTLVAAAVAQLENKVNHRLQDKKPTHHNKSSCKQMPVDTKKSSASTSVETSKHTNEKLSSKDSSSSENEEYKSATHKAESTASDSMSMKSSERDSSDSEESSTSGGSSLTRRTPQDAVGSAPHQVRADEPLQSCEGMDNNAVSHSDDDDDNEECDSLEDEEEYADELVLAVSGLHPAVSSYMYSSIGSDSDSPDDSSTVKCGTWSDSNISVGHPNSSSSDTSSSSGKSHKQKGKSIEDTTLCDDDFQWIKTEPAASVSYDKSSHPMGDVSPAPDTDEEECRKIVQAKRPELPKFCSEKPPVPTSNNNERGTTGSLDRRRYHPPNRVDRDQKSKSTHNLKGSHYSPSKHYNGSNNNHRHHNESPGPYVDYMGNHSQDYHSQDYGHQYHSFTPPRQLNSDYHRRTVSYEQFNRRHEHNDPHRYGSNSMLMDRMDGGPKHVDYHGYHHPDMRGVPYHYGSRSDIHGSHGELSYCGGGPVYPPCCHHSAPPWCSCGDRYRTPYSCKNSEGVDDKIRRLESDKEQLQLQVTVLSEQIAAQSEKINDLERLLTEKRSLLTNAEELLQREMLTRSSLETQKLELMSTISDARLRQAALERENIELRSGSKLMSMSHNMSPSIPNGGAALRRQSPSPCPSPGPVTPREGSTPRTPPATYRRLVSDQSPHQYSSLPRGASLSTPVSRPSPGPQQSSTPLDTAVVVRFADKDTVIGTASPVLGKVGNSNSSGKGWGNLWRGGSGGALEDVGDGPIEPFQRGGVRATAAPRLQTTIPERWNTVPPKEWDTEITCEWLESLGLDCYNVEARKWLTNLAGNRGILASATHQQIEKELNLKNPLHKKKLVLALMDLQGGPNIDPQIKAAGRLDCAWALRWLEDAGLPQYREAWAAAGADGRVLHLLSHEDLHALKVTSQLHALSIKRGIQVLRENNFSPETMIRRATVVNNNDSGEGGIGEEGPDCVGGHVSRWSSHRVMEWLRAVDLAEYAPNLRGAGVHGGLMYYEVRFTGELLATLLNIPPSKTLLRRHLNTRFNQLLGKEVIQEKREAEQTLGYQPLTLTSKVKVVKKGQFTLKRKKNKGEPEYGDLVCPIVDQASGEILSTMKMEVYGGEGAASRQTDELSSSTDSPHSQRSDRSHS